MEKKQWSNIIDSKSDWINEAKQRQENNYWLKYSQKIAIKVLKALREKNIEQKQLAELMNITPKEVNNIVKGKENLTLETLSKLESVLDIKILTE